MKMYFNILIAIIFVLMLAVLYQFVFVKEEPAFEAYPVFCGTPSENLDSIAAKGKELSNSYCSACHKVKIGSTGPPLIKASAFYKEKNINLYDYLTGKRGKPLFENYNLSDTIGCPVFPMLGKSDVGAMQHYYQQSGKKAY